MTKSAILVKYDTLFMPERRSGNRKSAMLVINPVVKELIEHFNALRRYVVIIYKDGSAADKEDMEEMLEQHAISFEKIFFAEDSQKILRKVRNHNYEPFLFINATNMKPQWAENVPVIYCAGA